MATRLAKASEVKGEGEEGYKKGRKYSVLVMDCYDVWSQIRLERKMDAFCARW